jgi:PTS system nitrogen regulatory IIA component
MNQISVLLPIEHVLVGLDVGSKKRLFEQVGLLFENTRHIARAKVFDSLFDREKLGSTGLGHGVAIPHGRIKGLKETLCAFAKTRAGIPFESPDGEPVRLVFAMLVPEHATEQHLEILSELAQMFSDRGFRERLAAARDAAAVHALFEQWVAS